MKIPDEVKIGAHVYKVTFRSEEGEEDGRFGHCRARSLKIYIDDRVPQSQQEETFFHECIHAMFYAMHSFGRDRAGYDEEEKMTQSIGHAFYEMLKDNDLLKHE